MSEAARYAAAFAAFEACRALPEAEREPYLTELLGGDEELRDEVLALLESDRADDALADERIAARAPFAAPLPALAGGGPIGAQDPEVVGPYRILRCLGQGGMGVVYEAEREFPRRRVALKLIRSGAGGAASLKRFQREAGILARLQHPGIAQLFDFGTFESAVGPQPYFALELVEGADLRTHCAQAGLDVRERLRLIALVCDAVQHAHERGILHRDLKPDNVMVDAEGRPKVLDFGVARLLDEDASLAASLTQTGQIVGTLSYMAPEQLSLDPRGLTPLVDVYALGAIAFELLSGRPPHSLAGLTPAHGMRVVAESDVTRLDTVTSEVPRDVVTIIGKALERDPARRYGSAAAVAADLRRYLAHEPISARPPSRTYRLTRFVRRHRGLSVGAASTFLVLLAGVIISTYFGLRAARELRESQRQSYRAALAAAGATIDSRLPDVPRRHLESAPEPLRGWEWRYYAARLAPAYREVGPAGYETAAAVGLVKDWLAACYKDQSGRSMRVYSASTGEELWRRPVDGLAPRQAAFRAQDSELVVLARTTEGGTDVLVFDASSGEELEHRRLCEYSTNDQFLSADGRRCADVDSGLLVVMDVSSGERIDELPGRTYMSAFGLDGQLIAYSSAKSGSCVLDLDSGKVVFGGLAYLSPRTSLAVTFGTQTIEVRNLLSPESPPVSFHSTGFTRAALLSPDGRHLALANGYRLELLDVETGESVGPRGVLGGPGSFAFLPGGEELVSFGGPFQVFPVVAEASVFSRHTSYVYTASASPDGGLIASGSWDRSMRVWDRTTREELWRWDTSGMIYALDWLDEDLIVNDAGDVIRLDPERRIVWRYEGDGVKESIEVNPGGTRILVTTENGVLLLLDAATGEVVAEEDLNVNDNGPASGSNYAAAWSPKAGVLAAVSATAAGSRVDLRAADDLRVLRSFGDWSEPINQLSFSPDGRLLATSCADKTVRVFDVATGALVCPPLVHEAGVLACAFSPDGTRLATGGSDRIVHIYETERYEELIQLHGHEAYIYRLEWSPDGEALISASGDTTVRIWDAAGALNAGTEK